MNPQVLDFVLQYNICLERNVYRMRFQQMLSKSAKVTCLCNYIKSTITDSDFDNSISLYLNNGNNTKEKETFCNTNCHRMGDIYNKLERCFQQEFSEPNVSDEERKKFEAAWSRCVLSKVPHATNHVGTTIFHQAASDNNLKLLKCALKSYPDATHLIDSKGMNILHRACQRNLSQMVEYLLKDVGMNPDGNQLSAQTPLLISITNGYEKQAELLLRYRANPSQIDMVEEPRTATYQLFSILVSPLRASILLQYFQIMNNLLKYGANVYELFPSSCEYTNSTYHEYLDCLKLLFRHLNDNNFEHMIKLNEFLPNVNVYRMIFISFLKINFQNECGQQPADCILLSPNDYSTANLEPYEASLFEYLKKLLKKFYEPKTLKDMCRFKIRDHILKHKDRRFSLINELDIPKTLKLYLLHEY